MRLATRLLQFGYHGDAEAFKDLVHEQFRRLFPADTDENVLFHPRTKAVPLCDAVRERVGLELPDDVVLSTLVNLRKHSLR
jgi:hypothetical protein